jgi:hypothetical protein
MPFVGVSINFETWYTFSGIVTYHATTPLPGSDAFVGSRITPSVLVLEVGRLAGIQGVLLLNIPANINTNPEYSVHSLLFG